MPASVRIVQISVGVSGLEVVVAEDRDDGDFHRAHLTREHARFLRQPVVGEIAAQHEHVRALGHLGEQRLKDALRVLATVHVADSRHTDESGHGVPVSEIAMPSR